MLEKTAKCVALWIVFNIVYYLNDQVEEDEVEWDTCYTWERGEMYSGSCLDSLKKRYRFADLGVDGKIILKCP